MVVVGDTTDVFLYDVIGGGSEFKRIGHYQGRRVQSVAWTKACDAELEPAGLQGSSDSGFSTAWSKEGGKVS